MRFPFSVVLSLLLTGCGVAQGPLPSSTSIPPSEATKAARRSQAVPYPTATDTPAPPKPTATGTATPARGPSATPAAGTPTPSSQAGGLASFACTEQSGGQAQPASVVSSRMASQSGYDRFVIEFDKGVPQYDVKPQGSARFVESGSGRAVTLQGSSGLLIDIRPTSGHGGSSDLKISHGGVSVEARKIGDFEGVTQWGIGLSRMSCFRAFTLQKPPRLVVDIAPAP